MKDLQVIENGLVPVYTTDTGEKVVDGRELWTILESKREFTTWVKDRLIECDARENVDFSTFDNFVKREGSNLGTKKTEYILKLAIAKEMAMLERNEKGKQVRKYFITVEEKYQQLSTALQKENSILAPPYDRAKMVSIGEVTNLLKVLTGVMRKQDLPEEEIATQVKLTCDQFGIKTVPNFIKPSYIVRQITITDYFQLNN